MKNERIIKVILRRGRNKNERCNKHTLTKIHIITCISKVEGKNPSTSIYMPTWKVCDEEREITNTLPK
jgi:hypothetical protein